MRANMRNEAKSPVSSSGRVGTAYTEALTAVASRLRTPMFVSERAVQNEQDIIDAIERWLAIPHLSGFSENDLAASVADPSGRCTDPDFPPSSQSLFSDPEHPPATAPRGADWKRVQGQLYIPTSQAIKVLQGALGNRWFLGALACVASRQDLMLDLIVSDNQAARGLYTFQFYKHGCWHQVVVDDHLPCVIGRDEVLFACSGTPGELWPSLIEKAYAKLHGSYFALDSGSISDALVDLTGGVVTKLKMDTEQAIELADNSALWSRLLLYCSWGYVMAVQRKVKACAPEASGPGGVLLNHAYSIIDCRALPDGARLVRIHNPWPTGQWEGAWRAGSREWDAPGHAQIWHTAINLPTAKLYHGRRARTFFPVAFSNHKVQQYLHEFEHTFADPSTFWMSYVDFAKAFNRLYVTRLFPPTWHQLTLHSGWHGRTAGGPMLVAGLPNSTWCCNPQFKVSSRKAGELLLCVSQQDPMIVNGGHVKKRNRTFLIGLQVVRIPHDSGRCWTVEQHDLITDTGLVASRELSVSIRLDPAHALMVIPYCNVRGREGPFVLRTFSSTAIEIMQVPSPLALVIGGTWSGHLAGGRLPHATWASNPQYMLSTQQQSRVMISLIRSDLRQAILQEAQPPEAAIGMAVVKPEMGDEGLGRCCNIVQPSDILAESKFDAFEEAVMLLELHPEQPYILVPSMACAGMEAPFEIRLLSSVPVELVPLPDSKSVVLSGEWQADSGGCDLHPFWFKRNPKFVIRPHHRTLLTITLTRLPGRWRRGTSLDKMIGFYILAASDTDGTVQSPNKSIRAEATFVPLGKTTLQYELTPTERTPAFVLVPCTYGPGCKGAFRLSLTAPSSAFDVHQLAAHDGTLRAPSIAPLTAEP